MHTLLNAGFWRVCILELYASGTISPRYGFVIINEYMDAFKLFIHIMKRDYYSNYSGT